MKIKLLHAELIAYLKIHNLSKKWGKAQRLFENNPHHPSLHTELLEPHWRGIYSFRLDKRYRALFFIEGENVEVFQITKHYKK